MTERDFLAANGRTLLGILVLIVAVKVGIVWVGVFTGRYHLVMWGVGLTTLALIAALFLGR